MSSPVPQLEGINFAVLSLKAGLSRFKACLKACSPGCSLSAGGLGWLKLPLSSALHSIDLRGLGVGDPVP